MQNMDIELADIEYNKKDISIQGQERDCSIDVKQINKHVK